MRPAQILHGPVTRAVSRARSALPWAAGVLLVAFTFLPFAVSSVFPSQDGPAHLHTASLLALLREGGAPVAASMLVEHDPGITNLATYWLLSQLLRMLPAPAAEWTMAIGLTSVLLAAVLASIRLLGGRIGDALLGVLLCAPFVLYMGSLALVLGMALAFLALAFLARMLRSRSVVDGMAFVVLGLVACAAQIQVAVPILAATFGGIGASILWRWLHGGGWTAPRTLVAAGLATLPVLGAAAAFNFGPSAVPHAANEPYWSPVRQVAILVLRRDVAAFSMTSTLMLGAVSLLLGLAAVTWLLTEARRMPPAGTSPATQQPWLLFATLAVAGTALVLPMGTEAVPHITHRLASFAHFLLLLWFVVTPIGGRWRVAVVAVASVAALFITASRSQAHLALAREAADLMWAEEQVPDHSLVSFLSLPATLQRPAPSMQQAGAGFEVNGHLGRGLKGRDVVSLSNFQLMPVWRIFRLRLLPEVASDLQDLAELQIMVGRGGLRDGLGRFRDRLRAATGHDLDMVLIWRGGLEPGAAQAQPLVAAFLSELSDQYVRRAVSPRTGQVEIWQRRPD